MAAVEGEVRSRYAEHSALMDRIAQIEAKRERRMPTLTVQIETVYRERPDARASAVAEALNCAPALVYKVRARVLAGRKA